MLEGVFVILNVVIVVVGVGKEVVTCSKDVCSAQVRPGQSYLMRLLNLENFLGIVAEILAQLVSQVGVGVLVAHYLYGVVASDATVVRCQDNSVVAGS